MITLISFVIPPTPASRETATNAASLSATSRSASCLTAPCAGNGRSVSSRALATSAVPLAAALHLQPRDVLVDALQAPALRDEVRAILLCALAWGEHARIHSNAE